MMVFDGILNYTDRPSSGWPLAFPVANFATDWPIQASSEVDETKCATLGLAAKTAKAGLIYIDDSWPNVWPIDLRSNTYEQVSATMEKLIKVVDLLRKESGGIPVSVYSLPKVKYWPDSANSLTEWQVASDALSPLLSTCSYILPSLYSFYASQESWPQFAYRMGVQSKRYGKPVVGFLWPRVHESNQQVPAGQYLDATDFRMQLNWVKANLNGAVIWDSATPYNASTTFDTNYPWWAVLKSFPF